MTSADMINGAFAGGSPAGQPMSKAEFYFSLGLIVAAFAAFAFLTHF